MNDLFGETPQKGDIVVSKSRHEDSYSDVVGVQFRYVNIRQRRPCHVMTYMDGKTPHYDDDVRLVVAT